VNKIDFKFTLDDLNNEMIKVLHEQPEQAKPKGKPNLIDMLRSKKEQGKPTWPLT